MSAHARKVKEWDMHIIDVAGKTIEQICRESRVAPASCPLARGSLPTIDQHSVVQNGRQQTRRMRQRNTATAKPVRQDDREGTIMPSQQN